MKSNYLTKFGILFQLLVLMAIIVSLILQSPFDGVLLCSLVPVKPKRLTKTERAKIFLTPYLKEAVVGLLLGDLCIQKQAKVLNARLLFEQGIVHKEYLFHLFDLFRNYCMTEPKVYTRPLDKRTGGIYTKVSFKTCAFPCFTELYNIFYFEGKKIIPLNIGELLTPVGLAYLICDDGGKTGNGFHFATNGFTAEDVRLLIDSGGKISIFPEGKFS